MTCHSSGVPSPRQLRGAVAYRSGALAEEQVAARYIAEGYVPCAQRWRGQWGEIDLIFQRGACTVFVEVKKSTSHHSAALRLNRRQMDRICATALDFCATLPDGLLSEMRFDLAMVDALGRIDVLENAFGEA